MVSRSTVLAAGIAILRSEHPVYGGDHREAQMVLPASPDESTVMFNALFCKLQSPEQTDGSCIFRHDARKYLVKPEVDKRDLESL